MPALAESLADALPNGHEKSIAQTMLGSIRGLEAEGLDFLRLASVTTVVHPSLGGTNGKALIAEFEQTEYEDGQRGDEEQ